ncbi:hypothetical protein MAR_036899 [Mya arenaria]|uniref:Uncharacterized protein n=1 Tax=Mya arenaria TaxID=6604 RepID=A0ABY7FLY2_MYAAR|nr:hypothetical protein MAR_036899 [Mya arenaria]
MRDRREIMRWGKHDTVTLYNLAASTGCWVRAGKLGLCPDLQNVLDGDTTGFGGRSVAIALEVVLEFPVTVRFKAVKGAGMGDGTDDVYWFGGVTIDGNDVVEGTDDVIDDAYDNEDENDEADDMLAAVRCVIRGMGTSSGSLRGVTSMCCTCTIEVAGGKSTFQNQ